MHRLAVAGVLALAVTAGACAGRAAPATASDVSAPPTVNAPITISLDTTARWVSVLMAWSDESAHAWTNDSLRGVLIDMARVDQAVRQDLTPERLADTAFIHAMARVDSANARQLRNIIARFGWPTKSMVGAKGASAAWLIVQHVPELQEEGERLMLSAPPGEVSPADLALLIDRRLVSQGKPQRYGSQLQPLREGETVMSFYPIEDLADLDARRAEVGLMPLADYIRMMEGAYHVKVEPPAVTPRAAPSPGGAGRHALPRNSA